VERLILFVIFAALVAVHLSRPGTISLRVLLQAGVYLRLIAFCCRDLSRFGVKLRKSERQNAIVD